MLRWTTLRRKRDPISPVKAKMELKPKDNNLLLLKMLLVGLKEEKRHKEMMAMVSPHQVLKRVKVMMTQNLLKTIKLTEEKESSTGETSRRPISTTKCLA